MSKMRAALIVERMRLKKWQADALAEALPLIDIALVLNCENTKIKRRFGKHFLY